MAKEAFELEIVSPSTSVRASVVWVEVDTPDGTFVVGPDHHPLVALLKYRGTLTYKEYQGDEASIDTYGGLCIIDEHKATIIMD